MNLVGKKELIQYYLTQPFKILLFYEFYINELMKGSV